MTARIEWSDDEFQGTADLYPGRINASRSFTATDPATGEGIQWDPDDLPQMEIPTSTTPLIVDSSLDESTGLIAFAFTAEQSDAALAAGHMWWVEAGQRLGDIRVGQR